MKKLGTIPKVATKFAKWYIGPRGRIPMRSGYEVAYAHFLDSKKIYWEYEPMTFFIGPSTKYKGSTYTPDFWLPTFNTFVEIKGRYYQSDRHKVIAFHKKYGNYHIGVAVGKDFRDHVGKKFMEIGGTAPPVTDPRILAVLNDDIVGRV